MVKVFREIIMPIGVICILLLPVMFTDNQLTFAQSGLDPEKAKPKPSPKKPAAKPNPKADSPVKKPATGGENSNTSAKKPDTVDEKSNTPAKQPATGGENSNTPARCSDPARIWEEIKQQENPETFQIFIQDCGSGNYVELAKARLDELRNKTTSVAVKPPASEKSNPNMPTITLPAGITVSMLRSYEFTTPSINNGGAKTGRKDGRASCFVDDPNGIGLEMTYVPGGTYMMGSPVSEPGRSSSEGPQHQVTVPDLYVGRYSVTIGQWKAVMGDIPEGMKTVDGKFTESNDQPVVGVSWEDAQAFCKRLSQMTGRHYRLPTEAEWEYAARAGTTTPFAFGENITPEVVNYNGGHPYGDAAVGTSRGKTAVVGSLGVANPFGLYDMQGNVWQWCQDWYHPNYDGAPADVNAWESGGEQRYRVVRGGSWINDGRNCRSTDRDFVAPENRYGNIGFRVVVSAR